MTPMYTPSSGFAWISIHIPHTGDDLMQGFNGVERGQFQSTSPTRGMTAGFRLTVEGEKISIHIPHTGDDIGETKRENGSGDFNPHPPHGG